MKTSIRKIIFTRYFGIVVLVLIGLFGISFFIESGEGIFLPLRIFVDDIFSDYDDSIRKSNYDVSTILDCNNPDNPYNEYECFRDAFSNCYNAIVNPEIYTNEGDTIYTTMKITPNCTIQGTIDTSTDRFGVPKVITTECLSVGRGWDEWTIGSCDAENRPEMQFNFEKNIESEQYKTHPGLGLLNQNEQKTCETFSGIWNKDFATCFDFSDDYNCEDMGGKLEGRAYTGEQPDYSKKSDSFACEFVK